MLDSKLPLEQTEIEHAAQPQVWNKKKLLFIVGAFVVLILGFFVVLFFMMLNSMPMIPEKITRQVENVLAPSAKPTPFAFEDMTIPYLRNQTYVSTLGNREQIGEDAAYTSYLTNYTSDGLRVNGLLTIPTGAEPESGWPAIIFIHGYIPPAQYQTQGNYVAYVDYLARNGFVVFKIDLRGHGSSEGEAGGGYFGSDYIVDTLNAYAALQSSDFVNPQKIGLWGHSMAGNVSLRTMAAKPNIPAVVIWSGAVYTYTDREKYGINDLSFSSNQLSAQHLSRRRQLFEKYGSPSATSIFWKQVIPTNYLHDLKGAIALHHAQDDDVVNIGYSRDLTALLDETSVPHEFFAYPLGGHNISGASFNQAMQRTVDFFKKYL